jgi:Uma2 family endonuclease
MSSILDLPSIRQRLSRISVAEYHRRAEYNERGRRTELIRGIVIEKMPKSPLHGTTATLLHKMLIPQVPSGWTWRREEPLTFHDSEPEPDIAIVRGDTLDYRQEHPHTADLAIEVAVANPEEDREKAVLYAEANVPEYWIVLPVDQSVEVYRTPERGRYHQMRVYTRSEELMCNSVPGIRVSLAQLFS